MWDNPLVIIRLSLAAVLLTVSIPIFSDESASMAFLEFLGEWETPEGEPVDPFVLVEVDESDPAGLANDEEEHKK